MTTPFTTGLAQATSWLATLAQDAEQFQFDFEGGEAAAAGLLLVFVGVGLVIGIAIAIVIAFLFWKPYSKVPQQFQTISPGLIWLLVIPLVNIVMMFIVAFQVPPAFKAYFDSIGDQSVGDAGKQVGMWWAICAILSIIPILGMLAGLASLVLLILFLVKLWGMAGKIPEGGAAPPQPAV